MIRTLTIFVILGACFVMLGACRATAAGEPLLRSEDRVAIVGGTLIERLQYSGALEAELQCRRPDWKLVVRNLGWSGDDVHSLARKGFGQPEEGRARLLRDVETANPNVVLLGYGSSEAANGPEAVAKFEAALRELAREFLERDLRVILLQPVAMPGVIVDGYEENVARCRTAVDRVGAELELPVVSSNWKPETDELAASRLVPNQRGYQRWSIDLADALVGGRACSRSSDQLERLITRKNQTFFHRYRPQNETYLYLFRKAEQGNNAVEVPQFEPLVESLDQQIWAAASR